MKDEFKAEFVIDLARDEVLDALLERVDDQGQVTTGGDRLLLPGFPSFVPTQRPGAICTTLEFIPEQMLRVRKEHEPCAGTEIAIGLTDADTGTRITIVQSGFGAWFEEAKDTILAHGNEIVADFRLFLETGHRAAPKKWGAPIGGSTRETPTGLEVTNSEENGFFGRAEIRSGDLILTLSGTRIYNTGQLWIALSFFNVGDQCSISWLRDGKLFESTSTF